MGSDEGSSGPFRHLCSYAHQEDNENMPNDAGTSFRKDRSGGQALTVAASFSHKVVASTKQSKSSAKLAHVLRAIQHFSNFAGYRLRGHFIVQALKLQWPRKDAMIHLLLNTRALSTHVGDALDPHAAPHPVRV